MNTGRRRHPVEIQKYSSTQNPQTGEMVQGWATIGTEWASIEGVNGREFLAAAAEQSTTTTRVTIAYRDDLTTTHRFAYHGKKYDIEALLPNNNMTELVCMCQVGLI
ncbi:phage head closure protein [Stutzerimonas stutzeri]|uniref:phage head closure protein n=1 Tax=Stutzerimonas stutzeri TaxID=316 RepID=UPI0002E09F97|nr:phage head closure protein [Stutzerimonas stutzeri]